MANNFSVTVGTASTEVLNITSGVAPSLIMLSNDSNENIYLAIGGEAAVLNKGIRLNADGSSLTIDANDVCISKIYAICASGNKNLCVSYV